ncbi:MAG: homoserine dehydrogenase [Phycisphaerales bacterium]
MIAHHSGCRHRARVAVLGCGVVGSEVVRQVLARGDELGLEVARVLVRDPHRPREVPRELLTADAEEVFAAAPDVVVEAIGGVEPAGRLVERALRAGIAVVSANKTLLAHRGPALRRLSGASGAPLACEAAVGSAVPVLAALRQLAGDRVLSLRAVVNGTCNFILTRMESGLGMDAALREAQERGLAEADPSADLSGRDSAEKLCILGSAAGLAELTPDAVPTRGIEGVCPDDLAEARRAGRCLRLVAELEAGVPGLFARVGPALVPRAHPLASLHGEENGVLLRCELAGDLFLRGPGAGPRPTASAILGDVLRVLGRARAERGEGRRSATSPVRDQRIRVRGPRASCPARMLGALRERALEPLDLTLTRHGSTLGVRSRDGCAVALGVALATEGGESLVTPVLE